MGGAWRMRKPPMTKVLLVSVTLAMQTKTKSNKCSIVLAKARLMFWMKFIRYCSSSVADWILLGDFPLLYSP